MSEIQYNFPMLMMAADQCGSTARNMTSQLDDLKRGLQPMVDQWSGDAKAAYTQRQQQWDTAASDLRDLLMKIQKALNEAATKMQQRESANIAKFH